MKKLFLTIILFFVFVSSVFAEEIILEWATEKPRTESVICHVDFRSENGVFTSKTTNSFLYFLSNWKVFQNVMFNLPGLAWYVGASGYYPATVVPDLKVIPYEPNIAMGFYDWYQDAYYEGLVPRVPYDLPMCHIWNGWTTTKVFAFDGDSLNFIHNYLNAEDFVSEFNR